MCNPISLIITEDKIFLPPEKEWNHSHSSIMEKNNIPDGLIGDKYLRLEVTPPEFNIFRNKETNEKLEVDDTWKVVVDEKNIPDWYKNDKPNHEYRARTAAKKWFKNFPDNLLNGYKEISGDYSNITAGYNSILTAGYHSTLTSGGCSILTAGYRSTLNAGNHSNLISGYNSILTAGYHSTLTSGGCSILTAGYRSTLNAGNHSNLISGEYSILTAGIFSHLIAENNSTFCAGECSSFSLIWYDGERERITTVYVGENGIKPDTKYLGKDGKFTEIKE